MPRKKKRTVSQADIKKWKQARKDGLSIEAIAEEFEREERTVRKYLSVPDPRPALQQMHVHGMVELVDLVRSCLEPPILRKLPDYHELLYVRGNDWRLDPIMWFRLCTPDFSEEHLWGPEFPMLKSHMKESSFWKHLEQMKGMVEELQTHYDRMATQLFEGDRKFEEFWKSIQPARLERQSGWECECLRTPDSPDISPEDLTPYYDQAEVEQVIAMFEAIDSSLEPEQFDLEKALDQLNVDLLPDEIDPVIVNGACAKCP